jgi:hypothetical protein
MISRVAYFLRSSGHARRMDAPLSDADTGTVFRFGNFPAIHLLPAGTGMLSLKRSEHFSEFW